MMVYLPKLVVPHPVTIADWPTKSLPGWGIQIGATVLLSGRIIGWVTCNKAISLSSVVES